MGARLLVVAPHLDDAVFSVGQIVAAHPGALVVTVLAGVPQDAGEEERLRVLQRRLDDVTALRHLGARARHLNFLDDPYRCDPLDRQAVSIEVAEAIAADRPELVLVPLGLTHPDHVDVAASVQHLGTHVYEELPYRVWWPEETAARLRRLWDDVARRLRRPFPEELAQLDTGSRHIKARAVERYASELTDDVRAVLYVPERTWRLPR